MKVENGADLGELVAHKVRVLLHAINGSVGDDDLVDSCNDDRDGKQLHEDGINLPEHLAAAAKSGLLSMRISLES
jgi:hypothetical protein